MLDERDADVCVTTRKLVSLSLLEIFKDIVPGYRIRMVSEKEKQQTVRIHLTNIYPVLFLYWNKFM